MPPDEQKQKLEILRQIDGWAALCAGPLPALTGSEKQRKWAEAIRAKYVESKGAVIDYGRQRFRQDIVEYRHLKMLERWYDLTLTITPASWWIDNRSNLDLLPPDMMPGQMVRKTNALPYYEYDGILYTTTNVPIVERFGRGNAIYSYGDKAVRLVTEMELLDYEDPI